MTADYPRWMRRIALVVLLVLMAGCSRRVSPDEALAKASPLIETGDFRKATVILRNALYQPGVSEADAKKLSHQIDMLRRVHEDYSFTRAELYDAISDAVSELTPRQFNRWVNEGRFDGRRIDGKMYYVNTSVANLFFRYPDVVKRRVDGHYNVPEQKGRLAISRAIRKAALEEKTPYVLPHHYLAAMTVQAGTMAVRPKALVRAWLPIPRLYPYQCDFKLVSNSSPVKLLAPENSPIRSAYMEQNALRDGSAKFEITFSYTMDGVSFDLDPAKIQAPDMSDPVLKQYTSESPHVVFTPELKELSAKIAGTETNPMLIAKAFYDWIGSNIKYSYAREYSTLTNIGDYCLSHHYGDCGQEAMLFITLCRSKGIPARWQTGWDIYPKYHDIHDWSEIYLAPYGWVPVDAWAGMFATRYCTSLTPVERAELHDFYFGGLDYYRMAANCDHSQQLDPPKQSARSDDVDFQRGELESNGRDIYFDDYSYSIRIKELK